MSGGSFDYLYAKLEDWRGREGTEDGFRMAARLEEFGFEDAAMELRDFLCRKLPVDLIELIRVVEWHDSADYGFDQVIRANADYLEYLRTRTEVPS